MPATTLFAAQGDNVDDGYEIDRGIHESARGLVAFIDELPGANTQGATLEELRENLNDAVALVLDANRAMAEESLEGAAVIRETFVLSAA